MNSVQEMLELRKLQDELNRRFEDIYTASERSAEQDITRAKEEMVHAAQAAITICRAPVLQALELIVKPIEFLAITICIELNIPQILASGSIKTSAELAAETKADPVLLHRLLRLASCNGYFEEVGPSQWRASALTHVVTDNAVASWIQNVSHKQLALPTQYVYRMRQNDYQTVWTKDDNPYQDLFGATDLWEVLATDSRAATIFDDAMKIQELFPPSTRPVLILDSAASNEDVLLVDVGGGAGQAISTIRHHNPDIQGKFILQDLRETIDSVQENTGFSTMIHDFFDIQPVHGAKYYHFRRIFHDWDDNMCLKILAATKPAMLKDHSKLIIEEIILPDKGTSYFDAGLDILMMMWFNGRERSVTEWRSLLNKAGFKIDSVTPAEVGTIGLIQASIQA